MRYYLKAFGRDGIVTTMLEASDDAHARRLAEHQGLKILSLRPKRSFVTLSLPKFVGRRKKEFPLVLFSQELATLLNAGLPLIDALESLAEQEDDVATRKVFESINRLLYEGKSFSQALASFPETFPELFVALIQSSERTGDVGNALSRYVAYRSRIDIVRQKIVSASVYPALLFTVGGGVLLFLLGYVVPRFSVVFEDLGTDLPWLSRVLLSIGQTINQNQIAFVGVIAGGIAAVVALSRVPEVRRSLADFANGFPAVRQRVFIYQMARLYRSLGILLQGGIPVLTAIGMVRGLVDASTRTRLIQAAENVRQGRALSHALSETGLSTPVSQRMLRAGEQAGNLGAMMERTADFYDEEMGRWIEWFVRLFEPLLMVFVGGLIGIIVILMYIPIFELASSIQ